MNKSISQPPSITATKKKPGKKVTYHIPSDRIDNLLSDAPEFAGVVRDLVPEYLTTKKG